MATYLDELRRIQRELRHQIRNDVLANIQKASNREAIGVSILVVVLLVSPVIIFLVRNAAATIQVSILSSTINILWFFVNTFSFVPDWR